MKKNNKTTIRPYHSNPKYIDYLEKCREICNKIYMARNITLREDIIIEALKEIDKLQSHECFNDDNAEINTEYINDR